MYWSSTTVTYRYRMLFGSGLLVDHTNIANGCTQHVYQVHREMKDGCWILLYPVMFDLYLLENISCRTGLIMETNNVSLLLENQ